MGIETRIMESTDAAEIYITAVPCCNKEAKKQAEEIFNGIAEILSEKNARIFQERLFATRETMDDICATRRSIYGNLDDTVAHVGWQCRQVEMARLRVYRSMQ